MDRFRPYAGRGGTSHRRRAYGGAQQKKDISSRRTAKFFICVVIFAAAVLIKFLFPSTLAEIGNKINTVVNYKAALTALGEGISGEKKFTAALSEAFTYAFTGETSEKPAEVTPSDNADKASDGTVAGAEQDTSDVALEDGEAQAAFAESAATPEMSAEEAFSNAVIAAFLDSQEAYSDYEIPAGVSYSMPKILIDYTAPLVGAVSSGFGYRIHPTENVVKFHYGTDVAAAEGTAVVAFADGKVIATGESTTLGNYVIINHGDVESQYGHCNAVYVTSGQTVEKGDKIASVGATGNATDCCLHFELKINGVCVNPAYYIQWS